MNEPWNLFKVDCFLNIRELGTWCAVAMAHSLEPTVARIGAVTLVSSRTTVVRRRWTPSRPWHSMVKVHFSSTQLSCFGKVMPSQGDRGSRVRGCHCIKWVACHFARLCWLVMTRYTSPFLSSKSRQERSLAMSMPLGYVQWMLLSESWWCQDLSNRGGGYESWVNITPHVSFCAVDFGHPRLPTNPKRANSTSLT